MVRPVPEPPSTFLTAVPETPNSNLLPVRHPQPDLFICDVADAILKDVTQQMEHSFYSLSNYSLSKKPVTSVSRSYRTRK